MENIFVRKAIKEDCPRLLQLIQELADYEKAPQEVTVSLPHFIESGFGQNPVWWAFVACQNQGQGQNGVPPTQVVQGFALYYIRYSTWKGQRMYLEDILVTNTMRGKGIGQLLFEALIAEAKQKNLQGITWQVLDWNQPAIHFYKKYPTVFDAAWVNCSLNI